MATLAPTRIAGHAGIEGRIPNDELWIAVAIALAESSGRTDATNRNVNGSIDVGLWQINSVHRQTHPEWTPEWLKVPGNNAHAMGEVRRGSRGWNNWTVYRSGAYRRHERVARSAASDPDTIGAISTEGGVHGSPDPLTAVANAIRGAVQVVVDAGKWLTDTHNVVRVVEVGAGVALALAAASILMKPVVEPIEKAAKAAVTKGAL